MRHELEMNQIEAPPGRGKPSPIRLVEFVKAFNVGGTEVQVLELLRGLPPRYQLQVGVLNETGPLMESVWKLGHLPRAFPLSGSYAHPMTAVRIAQLAHWLSSSGAELVHAHDLYGTLIAGPAAKLAGCKLVISRLDLAHFHSRGQRLLLSRLTALADRVIANARAIRDMLVNDEGIPPDRVEVVHNGIDLRRFDERAAAGLRSPLPELGDDPVVVHVANMNHPVKRQEDLLAALALLAARRVRLRALLVGDGPRRPWLEARAAELGVLDRVHFLGRRMDVPAIYERASFGVLCSSAEGLPNAVMEGMAARLPMVVTRVGGNPDLIAHAERGYLVEPHRPEELAAAFEAILANPGQAQQMGDAARAFVERNLTVERLCAEHDRVYQAALRGA